MVPCAWTLFSVFLIGPDAGSTERRAISSESWPSASASLESAGSAQPEIDVSGSHVRHDVLRFTFIRDGRASLRVLGGEILDSSLLRSVNDPGKNDQEELPRLEDRIGSSSVGPGLGRKQFRL